MDVESTIVGTGGPVKVHVGAAPSRRQAKVANSQRAGSQQRTLEQHPAGLVASGRGQAPDCM
jgi:hypothetical protein